MTRTERATSPRALLRDRSESKSGLDKSLRKGGGGQHNWGSLANERYLESAALDDEEQEFTEGGRDSLENERSSSERSSSERRSNSITEEEKRDARNFRKNALKGQDIDLSAIARTSAAVSTSPIAHVQVPMV